jgi:Carboxypeptidase regulatory-like domain
MIVVAALLAVLSTAESPARAVPEVRSSSVVTGGVLQLTIAPPIGGSEPLLWELRKRDRNAVTARTGTIETGTTTVRIENLDAGVYRVLIKGREPLQRHASNARITDGQVTEANVSISPLVVEGTVTFDGVPLGSPDVVIAPHDRAWEAKVAADADGRFAEELWQRGKYTVAVSHDPLVRVWGTTRSLDGEDRVRLELRVPNRRIRGRVTDAKTGAPVANVAVFAAVPFGEAIVRNRTRSADDGTFEFGGVEAGSIELSAAAEGHRLSQPLRFALHKDEAVHEERIVLEALPIHRMVLVRDTRGMPVPGAAVLAPGAGAGEWDWVANTGADGRATVYLAAADDRPLVFVVPRGGSFGFARLVADSSGVVPVRILASASLEVRMESVDKEPIAHGSVRMRFNGTVIPAAVIEQMARMQGISLYTDASGRMSFPRLPPGQYDLRPLVTKSDLRDRDSPKPAGPLSITLLPGPQTVVMKFTAK